MSNSIAARIEGDSYQSLLFWREACRLFHKNSKVISVYYEYNELKVFDDVVVMYSDGMIDENRNPLKGDYYQSKFHVHAGGAITWQGLMDPNFINAEKTSLLEHLRNAVFKKEEEGGGFRFILFSPWIVDPSNELADLHSLKDGSIIWKKILKGKTAKSKYGQVREAWKEHLDVDEEELKLILLNFDAPVKIMTPFLSPTAA